MPSRSGSRRPGDSAAPAPRSVSLVTLGCARNEVDSEELAARLTASGWDLTPADEASVVVVNTCGFIQAAKQESIDELLAAGRRLPRAIVCANDQTALGVMSALRKHGIDVPGTVAVTGFDDIPLARHLRITLTTVRQPIREMGRTAFEVLYSMIGGERPPERNIVLATELIRRESCGCPPGTGNDGEVWL